MKLSTFLFASTATVLSIAACAAPTDQEEVDSSSQALCPRGVDCTKAGTGGFNGGLGGDLVLVDQPTQPATFTCSGQLVAGDICSYVKPFCGNDPNNCPCEKYCRIPGPGGGFPLGSWSPCLAGHTYTCNYLGQCRCN